MIRNSTINENKYGGDVEMRRGRFIWFALIGQIDCFDFSSQKIKTRENILCGLCASAVRYLS